MSGFQIVRQKVSGYGPTGLEAQSDEVYIKILASFEEVLPQLKNARLHVFMCIALHEAKVILGKEAPLSLSSIQKKIGYSRNPVIDALDYLVEQNFIDELPGRGQDNEKQYRVRSYAWFGKSLAPAPASNSSDPTDPAAASNRSPLAPRPASNLGEHPHPGTDTADSTRSGPTSSGPVGSESEPTRGKFAQVQKVLSDAHDMNDIHINHQSEKDSSDMSALLEIFESFDPPVAGPNLDQLVETVDLETAQGWQAWIPNAPREFTAPVLFMVSRLKKNPRAKPPVSSSRRSSRSPESSSEPTRKTFGDELREMSERQARHIEPVNDPAAAEDEPAAEQPVPVAVAELDAPPAQPGYLSVLSTIDAPAVSADQIWKAALGELQLQLTRATFETWVKPAFGISFVPGTLIIGVRNTYAHQWLENRLHGMIERTVSHIVGRQTQVQFVIKSHADQLNGHMSA
ncbi:MAG: DnaA N-terminal domain-containing protein [Anaerolineae bacterium]